MTNAELIAQIRAEIERRIKELHEAEIDYREDQCDAIASCLVSGIGELQRVLTSLNTLEKSLPAKVADGDGLNGEIERYFEGWSDDSEYGQAVMRDGACAGVDECKDIARHFYDLGCRRTAEKYDEIEYNRQRAEEQGDEELEQEIIKCWQEWVSPSNKQSEEGVLPLSEFAFYARHFAQWGAEHLADASKTSPNDLEEAARRYSIPSYMKNVDENFLDEYPYDKVSETAFIAGAKWQKGQMMKDAVEGKIVSKNDGWNSLELPSTFFGELSQKCNHGDKVRIIVVKE